MLTIEDCERAIVESILADKELGPAVEDLLACLLADVSGYHSRSTDGVILEYSRVSAGQMVASGVVFMIDDQTVEPIRMELAFDASVASPRMASPTKNSDCRCDSFTCHSYGRAIGHNSPGDIVPERLA